MSLETEARIVRRSWKELPVTQEIIDQVHALADAQMVPVHDADPFLFEWAPNDPILDLDPPTDVEEGAETSEDESEDQSDEEDDDDSDDTESQDEEYDDENDDDSTLELLLPESLNDDLFKLARRPATRLLLFLQV